MGFSPVVSVMLITPMCSGTTMGLTLACLMWMPLVAVPSKYSSEPRPLAFLQYANGPSTTAPEVSGVPEFVTPAMVKLASGGIVDVVVVVVGV